MFATTKGDRFFDDWKVRRHYLAKGLDDVKRAFWWKQLVSILEYKRALSFTFPQAKALLADTSVAGSNGLVPLCLSELLTEKLSSGQIISAADVRASLQKSNRTSAKVFQGLALFFRRFLSPLIYFLLDLPHPHLQLSISSPHKSSQVYYCNELCEVRFGRLLAQLEAKPGGAISYAESFLLLWSSGNAGAAPSSFPSGFVLQDRLPLVANESRRFLEWLRYRRVARTEKVLDGLVMVKIARKQAKHITQQEKSLMSLTVLTYRAKTRVQKMHETKRLLHRQAQENRVNGLDATAEWCEAQEAETHHEILKWNRQLDRTLLATTKVRFESHGQASAQQEKRWAEEIETWLKLLKEE